MGRTGGAGGAISKIQGEMGRNAPLGAPSGIYDSAALSVCAQIHCSQLLPLPCIATLHIKLV